MSAVAAMSWGVEPVRARPARAAAVTSAAGERPAHLRLTRRGRVVVSLLSAGLGLGALLSGQSAVAEAPADALPVVTWTVQPGETLWAIASGIAAPGEDVRDVVADLSHLNGLDGATIQSGQELLVPRG